MMATDFRIESFDFKVYGICKVAPIVRNSTKTISEWNSNLQIFPIISIGDAQVPRCWFSQILMKMFKGFASVPSGSI